MTKQTTAGQGLSSLQRTILRTLAFDIADSKRAEKGEIIRWEPSKFYSTGASRAAVSNSLRRLEDRGLLVRLDASGQKIDEGKQRTAYIWLTPPGILLAVMSMLERAVTGARDKVEAIDATLTELEPSLRREQYEKLKNLSKESTFNLDLVLKLLGGLGR